MRRPGSASVFRATTRRSAGSIGRSAIADPIASLALLIDAAIGWPAALYARVGHPVGGFALLVRRGEARWNSPLRSDRRRTMGGIATLAFLIVVAATGGAAIVWVARATAGRWSWAIVAVAAWPALAQRSLDDHVRPVGEALRAGDLARARRMVAMIVGRDTTALDPAAVARAAIESLAESFCDGVAAPLFWLLLLGLPGVWAYKAVNTADSLIGHREERWRAFGWASARLDDALNYLPARLAALMLCLAGGGGVAGLRREAARHASPNAGWPEAAMAGVLGLRLAGPVAYDGVTHDKPWIGTGRATATGDDIARALRVYRRGCVILWLIAGVVAWVR